MINLITVCGTLVSDPRSKTTAFLRPAGRVGVVSFDFVKIFGIFSFSSTVISTIVSETEFGDNSKSCGVSSSPFLDVTGVTSTWIIPYVQIVGIVGVVAADVV